MTVWMHRRKGRIEGIIIRDDGDFVTIALTQDQKLKMFTESGEKERGDIIQVRKAFLTPMPPTITAEGTDDD